MAANPRAIATSAGRRNTLSYSGRTDDVRVDLRRAGPGGAAGERDHVDGIEDATGGSGDDVLIGDGRPNELIGGPGADRLLGLGGDDRIETGDASRTRITQRGGRGDEVGGESGKDNIHVTSDAGSAGNVIRFGSLGLAHGRRDRARRPDRG